MPVLACALLAGEFVALPAFVLGRRLAEKKQGSLLFVVGVVDRAEGWIVPALTPVKCKNKSELGTAAGGTVGVGRWNIVGVENGQRIGRQQSSPSVHGWR